MKAHHIIAIDQGTSSTKCILVDPNGKIVAKAQVLIHEKYPHSGWVEQDAEEIWRSAQTAVALCLSQAPDVKIAALGLSTQRESALIWERKDTKVISPLLSWQDQRTVALRDQLLTEGVEKMVREHSGLPLDPMFSALKLNWLLDQMDVNRTYATSGKWCMGTIDAFLISRLRNIEGKESIEVGNASRTQLLNIAHCAWDKDLLNLFKIPEAALPEVRPSAGLFTDAGGLHPSLKGVPVCAVMADSHSALFAHGVYEPGPVKATMGTGSSVMGLVKAEAKPDAGMCLTVAWDTGKGPQKAFEGNIRAAGSTLRWLAQLFNASDTEVIDLASKACARKVCLVPAFNGLGAPWWDAHAMGLISGLTLDTTKETLFAAALDSIAHQITDVVEAICASGNTVSRLLLDGGPSRNPKLRELLSSFIDKPVVHCSDAELSALGVAHLAGISIGLWDWEAAHNLPRAQQLTHTKNNKQACLNEDRARWTHAVAQSRLKTAHRDIPLSQTSTS